MDDEDFVDLIARAQSGDEAAVGRLLHQYEDDVRRMVRVRLPRSLRGQFDTMDFVQAVWKSFFTGCGPDPGPFRNERHLLGYLAGVARNKVFEEYRRRTQTRKYDLNREEPLYVRRGDRDVWRAVAAPDPSPSQEAQAGDRLAQLVAGRSRRDAEVVELRSQGLTFEEIAARTGLHERSVRRVIEAARRRLEARV
jgi:RNA polymerase sigma-70 factor (ECF subfamily)